MAGLIQVRNRFEHNRPHLETASGKIVTFLSDMRSPLKGIKVYFYPVQSESGAISGWTGIELYHARSLESPTKNTISVSFPVTLYGGYADPVAGEIVSEWGYIAEYNGEMLPYEWISDRDIYSYGATPTMGAQVAYRLETPVVYTLAPQTVKALKGANNVWSNANGEIDVVYWAHTGDGVIYHFLSDSDGTMVATSEGELVLIV